MKDQSIIELLKSWKLSKISSVEPIPSYWNGATAIILASGQRFVLKRANPRDDLDREVSLLSWLRERDIPVPALVKTRSGEHFVVSDGSDYLLYTWLYGKSTGYHYGTRSLDRAQNYGRAIGRLHAALSDWPWQNKKADLDLITHIQNSTLLVTNQNLNLFDCKRIHTIAKECIQDLEKLQHLLPVQWIHRDIHPGNMLFESQNLTGILDFNLIQKAPRIFDPCYCSTSILIGGWDKTDNRKYWAEIFCKLLAAYEEFVLLGKVERKALYYVLCTIEFIFMAFSLEQKQFDAALYNQSVLFWLHDNRELIGI